MTEATLAPEETIRRLLAGKWVIQAMRAAVELGIPEALATPKLPRDLAVEVDCEPASLLRLLRVLAGEGFVVEAIDDSFHLTELGEQLCADSQGELVRFVSAPQQWDFWPGLAAAMRSRQSAFEFHFGEPLYRYMETRPAEARLYDAAIGRFTAVHAEAIAEAGILGGDELVVDIGGGRGTLLQNLLETYPDLSGVLVDRPDVVEAAQARFSELGLLARCQFDGRDFFGPLPAGGDIYVLKHVVHNWDDESALQLLRGCAEAGGKDARIFVVDGLLVPGNRRDGPRFMDLEMMALTGTGAERSKPQFRSLFARASLRLIRTLKLTNDAHLFELQPKAKGPL